MIPGTFNSLIGTSGTVPIYVGTGGRTVTSGTSSNTATYPDGVLPGDLLLFIAQCDNADTINTPSGFTFVQSGGSSSSICKYRVFYKFHTTGTGVSVRASGDHLCGGIVAFRYINASSPIGNLVSNHISSGDLSVPMPTTTNNNSIVLTVAGHQRNSTSPQFSNWANPSLVDFQEILDVSTTVGWDGGVGVAYGLKVLAGAVSNTTATFSSTSICGGIVLNPV